MNQIARCDWLPERARWSHPVRSGLPAVSRKQNFTKSPCNKSFIDQVCSIYDGWILASFFFCEFVDLLWTSTSSSHPAILTSHLVNNPYIFPNFENCARCEKDLKNNKDNSLHLGRKYARIFVLGRYLFREANSFPRAELEENCELRRTDNVQGQISEHIFGPNGDCCLYIFK